MFDPSKAPATVNDSAPAIAPVNDSAPAIVTTPATAKARAMRMVDIKAGLPEFFSADTPALVQGLTDKGARVMSLAFALAGAAIERAQSGNMPSAWADVQKAGEALKCATKARVSRALDHVGAVKPAHLKSPALEDYAAFGQSYAMALVDLLTPPPATAKAKAPATDWKARAELLTVEGEVLRAELSKAEETIKALRAELAKVKAPATV